MSDTDRKLVTIREVSEIRQIEGADNIELAIVDGWQCVVLKGQFHAGQLAIYHEIDSFLDTSKPQYAFLDKESKEWNGRRGYRLRTKRLRKTLSQGLLLSTDQCPELVKKPLSVGDDVTELLEVVKWEVIQSVSLKAPKGMRQIPFPSFIPKTDEERIQNLPNVIQEQTGNLFEVTEKLDGTSATFFYDGKEFGVCSRNIWLKPRQHSLPQKLKFFFQDYWKMIKRRHDFNFVKIWRQHQTEAAGGTDGIYWQIARKYKFDQVLPFLTNLLSSNPNEPKRFYAFQGEIVGEGVQKNPYKLQGQEFYIFNIYDIYNRKYLKPDERIGLIESINHRYEVNWRTVPIIYSEILLTELSPTIQGLLEYADKNSKLNDKVLREGLVFKRIDGKFSFKVVSNKFLLKNEDK